MQVNKEMLSEERFIASSQRAQKLSTTLSWYSKSDEQATTNAESKQVLDLLLVPPDKHIDIVGTDICSI